MLLAGLLCAIFAQTTFGYSGEYVLVNELHHGKDASKVCQDKFGTNAATIYSTTDNGKAWKVCQTETIAAERGTGYRGGHFCYIGLWRNNPSNQEWYWGDDGSFASSTYSRFRYWDGGQPGGSERSVAFWNTDRWHDEWSDANGHQKPIVCNAPGWCRHVTDYHHGGYNAFSGAAKWEECPAGTVMGGFYRTDCHQLNCLSELTCVSPVAPNIKIAQQCIDMDLPVRHSGMRSLYNVVCPAGHLLRGIYHSDNSNGACGIQCMKKFRCCKYDPTVVQVEDVVRYHEQWWGCLDRRGQCDVDDDEFMCGMQLNHYHSTEGIWLIEEALAKRIKVIGKPKQESCSDPAMNPCDDNLAICTETGTGVACACKPGYAGDGTEGNCVDINECSAGTDQCQNGAQCVHIAGQASPGYRCDCTSGWSGDLCQQNIDECTAETDNCNANAKCTDTEGGFSCECNPGYSGNGVDCVDVDECANGSDDCDDDATCTNTVGGFTCSCNTGYSGDGKSCEDDDECTDGTDNCDENATCENIPGSFTCSCNVGYDGDGVSCENVNECATHNHACDVPNAYCTDTEGSYECHCHDGYSGDGRNCYDVKENYIVVWDKKNYANAAQFCANEFDSNLATLVTKDDYDSAFAVLGGSANGDIWIGLSDTTANEGKGESDALAPWLWQDGASCDYAADDLCSNDDQWNVNEPNNYVLENENEGEDCGHIRNGQSAANFGQGTILNDLHCGNEFAFLCNPSGSLNKDCVDDIGTFNWDHMTEDGDSIPKMELVSMDIDADNLAIEITVELEYLGLVTADDENEPRFGATYVLDFEDYNAHSSNIYEPGTCQNRRATSYETKQATLRDSSEWWYYSTAPQINGENLGSSVYLSYPPPNPEVGSWDVSMKDGSCDTIVYKGYFTWQNLRDCTSFDGSTEYTSVSDDGTNLNLEGTFYINVVSPYSYKRDYGFYRVYQGLSQPFIISVSKTVYVLGSTGINLMTVSVIAVYKEDEENSFKLVVLTETANYLQLTRADGDAFLFTKSDDNTLGVGNAANTFSVASTAENDGCLSNKNYICSQLWMISANDIKCSKTDDGGLSGGVDFSGLYTLGFTPKCRHPHDDESHCKTWLAAHEDIEDGVTLSATLKWKDEICDPLLFEVQFKAEMMFFADESYSGVIENDHLYQVGESTIYVEIDTEFPDATYHIFNVEVVNVWICTFVVGTDVVAPFEDPENGGCLTPTGDSIGDRDDYDEFFHLLYNNENSNPQHEYVEVHKDGNGDDLNTNIVRFSFKVPNEVARDTLYVQAELIVDLQELGERRRVLLARQAHRHPRAESVANQLSHFGDNVQIGIGNNEKPQQYEPNNNYQPINNQPNSPPQQPQQPINNGLWTINLESPWIIVIGCILGLILTFNIIMMCYWNCYNKKSRGRFSFSKARRSGYDSVKKIDVDSELNDDEEKALNVVSE